MSRHPGPTVPPAHAWDWLGRQRLVWVEARRRLAPTGPDLPEGAVRPADVPDWSDLLDRGPLRPPVDTAAGPAAAAAAAPDWTALGTRAEVVAALRATYPTDPAVRAAVDGAVADVAFLGRCGGELRALGLRTPPRGLRWWWAHLGGRVEVDPPAPAPAGVQLTLVDVLTGYGDPSPVG